MECVLAEPHHHDRANNFALAVCFGKTPAQNLELVRRLDVLTALGRPVLVGLSRKSTLGKLLGDPEATVGTAAASVGARWAPG